MPAKAVANQSKQLQTGTNFWVSSHQLKYAAVSRPPPPPLLGFFTPLFLTSPRPYFPVPEKSNTREKQRHALLLSPISVSHSRVEQHTAGCRHYRQRLDVTRPQIFRGQQQAEPHLTSILSCICGSSHVRQTHCVRDPLPIMAVLRNTLELPFQNLQRLNMNLISFTFPIPKPSETINDVKIIQTQTSKQQRKPSDCF